nr:MAG TPA: hypothetical protein [Caudoviricetes sp.]
MEQKQLKISYNKIISKMMGGVRLGKFKRKSKKASNCDCPAWVDYKNKSESILQ